MANLLKVLYGVVWTEESIPKHWRQGLIVSLYKKGDAEDPGNYRGITLLNVVGKLFCKILNNRLVSRLESERALYEGQAGFRELNLKEVVLITSLLKIKLYKAE